MAKKSKKQNDSELVLYNVTYEDGTLSSNRKVPREAVVTKAGE